MAAAACLPAPTCLHTPVCAWQVNSLKVNYLVYWLDFLLMAANSILNLNWHNWAHSQPALINRSIMAKQEQRQQQQQRGGGWGGEGREDSLKPMSTTKKTSDSCVLYTDSFKTQRLTQFSTVWAAWSRWRWRRGSVNKWILGNMKVADNKAQILTQTHTHTHTEIVCVLYKYDNIAIMNYNYYEASCEQVMCAWKKEILAFYWLQKKM